jgi:putative nucleotidyltransferase with HDIG domain
VPITALRRAMTALGIEEVKNLIVCALFYDGVLKKLGIKRQDVFALWKHSLLTAFTARALCINDNRNSDEGFTAGLLHDIGKTPLLLKGESGIDGEHQGWHNRCQEEREMFGADHAEIGFCMATEWKLPENYRNAIRLHHEEIEESSLVRLVKQADEIVTSESDDERFGEMKKAVDEEAGKIISLFVSV